MNRRSLLRALGLAPLATFLSPLTAQADEVWVPPPTLRVRADPDSYGSPPSAVTLVVTNDTRSAVELQAPRLVVITAGVRVPVPLTRIAIDGRVRAASDAVPLAAGGSARVELGFASLPETALAASRLDFGLRFAATGEASFSIRRG